MENSDHKTLCGKCGHEMRFNPISRTWICDDCMTSQPDLPEGSVRLFLAKGKDAGKEVSLWQVASMNTFTEGLGGSLALVGGGVIGYGFVSLTKLIGDTDSKASKTLRERIEQNPDLYPFCSLEVLMHCSRCNSPVRADQDGKPCGTCGTKIRIPLPPAYR